MKSSTFLLECCADSLESAKIAAAAGADRLELCANLVIGGTTPSHALFAQVKQAVQIPVHVLLRPRFGDFFYQDAEFEELLAEIESFKKAGADGVVIGCLTPNGELDTVHLRTMIAAAKPMSVTLHRAFDMCRDPLAALQQAKALGVDTILTSGCRASALEGADLLRQLTAADGPVIMAGAGINAAAIQSLLQADTGLSVFHMSGKKVCESEMVYRNPHVNMGLSGISEYKKWVTDFDAVAEAKAVLKSHFSV